jgi:thiamine kinase
MSPAEIAAGALGTSVANVRGVEQIQHGLTNRNWLVHFDSRALIVRLSDDNEAALQIDRRSEDIILRAVAVAGIGPAVLINDPFRRILVTEYLGDAWSCSDASVAGNVARLAALLRKLHGLTIREDVRVVDFGASVDGYLATLREYGAPTALGSDAMRKRAQVCAAALRAGARTCLCHNDLHHLNIVDDRIRLYLIDWEYAGNGEPFFDLASVCVYHGYHAAARRDLLASYHDIITGVAAQERLEHACWLFEYVRDLWFAVREVSTPPVNVT